MEREEIYEKLKKIISDSLHGNADFEGVTENTDLIERFGITSIINIEIVVRIESEFDIEINDDDLSTEFSKSLSMLADYVEKQIQLNG